ncbi:DUF7715 family protein [Microterricola pindariensis]|uniref:DUF7715 domain-containing protein n=1 Tax=Microterricola pindariensis TaxID=478010 RepID=A0ABX5AYF8_9MICO|nr:hypothetical protein [Microterricola pindariensis]PPL19580.1 hypothetical protein GY24_05175 [Microterricola pindariensis]
MKVLVATSKKQGSRPSDLMEGVEGELVFLVEPCPDGRRFPYGPCDCAITFRGCFSDGVTSTAMVRDLDDVGFGDLVLALAVAHYGQALNGCSCDFDPVEQAGRLVAIAAPLREGLVVERCVDHVRVRR